MKKRVFQYEVLMTNRHRQLADDQLRATETVVVTVLFKEQEIGQSTAGELRRSDRARDQNCGKLGLWTEIYRSKLGIVFPNSTRQIQIQN